MAPAKPRGGRSATTTSRRSANPPPPVSDDQPPAPSRPAARSTRSTTTRSTSTAASTVQLDPNDLKRGVPDDEATPAPNPKKTKKTGKNRNAETVNNAPFVPSYSDDYYALPNTQASTVYMPSGPSNHHATMPVQQNVHTEGSRHLISSTSTHPPPQRSVHFMTSNQWAPPRASPHPMTTAPPPSNSQPPPYRPPAQPRPVISIDTDEDFSDEELEVESTEEGEEDPSLIQFMRPLDVVRDHWRRNGPPAPSRPAPTLRTQPQPTEHVRQMFAASVSSSSVQSPRMASSSFIQSPHTVPSSSVQSPRMVPSSSTQLVFPKVTTHMIPGTLGPADLARQGPAYPDPVQPAPLSIPQMTDQDLPVVTPALPPFDMNKPMPRRSYPPEWRDFINHGCLYILHDMMFSFPFPTGTDGYTWAREAVSCAAASYRDVYHMELDRQSYGQHRSNFITLVLKAARAQRGRIRPVIMHIIFNTKELGISEKVPAFNVADRVEILISRNRYLDAPYLGDGRVPDAMYRSSVLAKVVQYFYSVHPWSTAMKLNQQPRNPGEGHNVNPATALVAFAATAYRNVLDSLRSGTEETVSFSDASYTPIFDELYSQIESDSNNREYGHIVRQNIQALLVNAA